MGLNKQKGNMYPWVTDTWNPIRGQCPNDCVYCYMKVYPQPELHFVDKEMETDLGAGKFIFVGSSTDMWAELVPLTWIVDVINHCVEFDNKYLFQSKNPDRFRYILFPPKTILGTTIESNRSWNVSKAPCPKLRYEAMRVLPGRGKMVSIEPIMDFDVEELVCWMREIKPQFVSIGADSKGHHLPEPSWDKVERLIEELSKFTEVKIKDNLKRLKG
jgi:DNA repair photolyase